MGLCLYVDISPSRSLAHQCESLVINQNQSSQGKSFLVRIELMGQSKEWNCGGSDSSTEDCVAFLFLKTFPSADLRELMLDLSNEPVNLTVELSDSRTFSGQKIIGRYWSNLLDFLYPDKDCAPSYPRRSRRVHVVSPLSRKRTPLDLKCGVTISHSGTDPLDFDMSDYELFNTVSSVNDLAHDVALRVGLPRPDVVIERHGLDPVDQQILSSAGRRVALSNQLVISDHKLAESKKSKMFTKPTFSSILMSKRLENGVSPSSERQNHLKTTSASSVSLGRLPTSLTEWPTFDRDSGSVSQSHKGPCYLYWKSRERSLPRLFHGCFEPW